MTRYYILTGFQLYMNDYQTELICTIVILELTKGACFAGLSYGCSFLDIFFTKSYANCGNCINSLLTLYR